MRIRSIPLSVLGLLMVFAISAPRARAQEPGKEATKESKIERILALTNSGAMIDQMFNQMKAVAAAQMPAAATPEQRTRALELQDKVMAVVKASVGPEKMRVQYVTAYSDTFTDEEISGLLAFYESPAGRAYLTKMPVLISNIMTAAQNKMKEVMPEIERIIKESVPQR